MSNNLHVTKSDFDSICRTCLSREDLKHLYEKSFPSTNLVDMLMACTAVNFTEDDGLPIKICTNCINEIKRAFSFAKRCETTDSILRKCAKESITECAQEKMEIEVKKEVFGDYECVENIKQEDVKIELTSEIILPALEEVPDDFEYVEVKQEKDGEIENVCDDLDEEGYEDNEQDKTQDDFKVDKSTGSHVCPVCGEIFAKLSTLKKHSLKIHPRGKSYTCEICSKNFTQSCTLKDHMRIHTGEKPYSCSVCNKSFGHSITRKRHMRLHTGEKPYACTVCSKTYSQPQGLRSHMQIHSDDKPYICKICSKAFTRSGTLKDHIMRKHTGEKPHVCSICNKAYVLSTHLKSHMRMHTGEKPFTCGDCGRSFTKNCNLIVHKRTCIKTNKVTANKIWYPPMN